MKTVLNLMILVIIISCNEKEQNSIQTELSDINESLIRDILSKMYEYDRVNSDLLNDSSLFSSEITELNEKCNLVTLKDRQRIANSPFPTDKPLLREGSSVTSLYEGATDFEISNITVNDNQIEIIVYVSNRNHIDLLQWNDKVILIEENGLKVDNIFFDKKVYSSSLEEPNLKEFLTEFSNQVVV